MNRRHAFWLLLGSLFFACEEDTGTTTTPKTLGHGPDIPSITDLPGNSRDPTGTGGGDIGGDGDGDGDGDAATGGASQGGAGGAAGTGGSSDSGGSPMGGQGGQGGAGGAGPRPR